MAKGPHAFRTISEAAEELGVPQHVLRFWESKFSFITPMKRAGGRRFYRPQDIAVLKGVRALLHDQGLTIKGVGDRLGLDENKVVSTVALHANTSAASIPLALDVAVKDGRIKRGDLVVIEAMGGGLTWGAVALRM